MVVFMSNDSQWSEYELWTNQARIDTTVCKDTNHPPEYTVQIPNERQAKNLDVESPTSHPNQWSESDLLFLKNYYSRLSAATIGKYIGKSENAVVHKASRIRMETECDDTKARLTYKHHWTEEDVLILRKYYPHHGSVFTAKYLPHRNPSDIAKYASSIGLKQISRRLPNGAIVGWKPEDLEILRKEYKAGNWGHLGDIFPERSKKAIYRQCVKMGLHTQKKRT